MSFNFTNANLNVVYQAFAEVPNLSVWYGPDSYMGANIVELFQLTLLTLTLVKIGLGFTSNTC